MTQKQSQGRGRLLSSKIGAMNIEDASIYLLTEEYVLLATDINQASGRIGQLVAIGASILGGIITLIWGKTVHIEPPLLWIAPLPVLIFYGVALISSFRAVASAMQLRLVSDRLLQLTGEPARLLSYHEKSVATRFQSLRRGNLKFRVLCGGLILMASILYVCLLALCFPVIYSESHLAGFLFLLLQTVLSGALLFVLSGVLYDLPRLYYRAVSEVRSVEGASLDAQALIKSAANPLRLLLPRPLDFVTKTVLFAVGVIVPLLENPPAFNRRIWTLFVTGDELTPPFWTIIAFSLCWLLIQEGIIQQAKYIWNDIRDRRVDTEFAGKRERAVTSGAVSPKGAIAHLVVRWVGGLLLGSMLDHRLLLLLLAISLTQILYELWGKPHGGPLAAALLVAVCSPERVLGGALSVGADLLDPRVVVLAATSFFFGIGYIACFWRVEAEYRRKRGVSISPRPQSEFFHQNGKWWQDFGFAGMFVCAVLLLMDALSGLLIDKLASDQLLSLLRGTLVWLHTPLLVLEWLTVMTATWGVTHAICRPWTRLVSRLGQARWCIWALLLAITALLVAAFTPVTHRHRELVTSAALLAACIMAFLAYERLAYEQMVGVWLRRNLKIVKFLSFNYFFTANSGLSLGMLLKSVGSLLEDTNTLKRKLAQVHVTLPESMGPPPKD